MRQELFGVERLEHHAKSLAAAQKTTLKPPKVVSLHARLDDNDRCLLAAYRGSVIELDHGRTVVPAAEWLLDNYHLVEDQIREIRDDLPLVFTGNYLNWPTGLLLVTPVFLNWRGRLLPTPIATLTQKCCGVFWWPTNRCNH